MPNAEMAQKILNVIEARPETFDMGSFIWNEQLILAADWYGKVSFLTLEEFENEEIAPDGVCGTTLCVSGFAHLFDGWKLPISRWARPTKEGAVFVSWEHNGADILGISYADAEKLFIRLQDDEEMAIAALRMLANGDKINWDEIGFYDKYEDDYCACGCEDSTDED